MHKKIQMLYFRIFKPHIYRNIKSGELVMKGLIEGIGLYKAK